MFSDGRGGTSTLCLKVGIGGSILSTRPRNDHESPFPCGLLAIFVGFPLSMNPLRFGFPPNPSRRGSPNQRRAIFQGIKQSKKEHCHVRGPPILTHGKEYVFFEGLLCMALKGRQKQPTFFFGPFGACSAFSRIPWEFALVSSVSFPFVFAGRGASCCVLFWTRQNLAPPKKPWSLIRFPYKYQEKNWHQPWCHFVVTSRCH